MNLTCVRFVGTLLRCGRISNSFKGTAGHTPAVDAVSRWILSCVVHRNSLSVSVRTVACIPGCRFYSNNGDQRYAGKALKVAFFIEDEDWALKAMEAAGLIGSEEGNSSSVLFLPNPGVHYDYYCACCRPQPSYSVMRSERGATVWLYRFYI